ncbi:MAG: ribbon-helix-helix protein, CopG family [Methanomassiliicoccus sp.]|nr:MAG: ribbon-helix-helix protein, CopG family [Methanomassiliicoccus sp.]
MPISHLVPTQTPTMPLSVLRFAERCEDLPKKKKSGPDRDDRITIKIEKEMWKVINKQIRDHPEWGVRSVSEFIRRAISHELEEKASVTERKVLEIQLRPRLLRADSHCRDPEEPRC